MDLRLHVQNYLITEHPSDGCDSAGGYAMLDLLAKKW